MRKGWKTLRLGVVMGMPFIVLIAHSSANTYYLNSEGTGDFPTIQAAVDVASSGDVLVLAPGTYTGEGNRDVLVEKSVVIRSTNPDDPNVVSDTVIHCGGTEEEPHRAFSLFTDSDIMGLTIRNGVSDCGGGIYCESLLAGNERIAVTLDSCRFVNNTADSEGGAVYSWIVNLQIQGSAFERNSSGTYGGAIYSYDSSPTVLDCTFRENTAPKGGGIATWCRGTLTVENTLFDGNSASHGSAIDNNHCKLFVDRSTFAKNSDIVIDGFSSYSRYCNVSNSVFFDNDGYAIRSYDPALSIDHCTFQNNPALLFEEGDVQCTNSILINAPISIEWLTTGSIKYCCFSASNMISSLSSSIDLTNNIVQDPLLDNGFAPSMDSPCLDAGSNDDTTATVDYYGHPRIQNRTTDMGAVELDHDQATIGINPTCFRMATEEGGLSPITKSLRIFNSGATGTVAWEVSEECAWLNMEPSSGLSGLDGDDVVLTIDPAGLSRGKYHCDLLLVSGTLKKSVGVDLLVNGTITVLPGEDVQSAIDMANDGDVVLLKSGRHAVDSLSFSGKKITMQGEDVYSTYLVPECFMEYCSDFFYFRDGETHDSKIVGLTITGTNSRVGSFHNSSPCFERCIFTGNTGDDLHLIYGDNASPVFDGCIFANNRMNHDLMEYRSGHIEIINCTFVDNACDYAILARASTVTVSNSLFWDEQADGEIYLMNLWSEGAALNVSYSDMLGGSSRIEVTDDSTVHWGKGNFNRKPMLTDAYHLMLNSPCINAGNPDSSSGTEDLDGQPRVSNGRVDVGADEYYLIEVPYDCETIQGAINGAMDGAEIVIYPGVYNEAVDIIGKNIVVRSYDPHDLGLVLATVIDCDSSSGVRLDSGRLQGVLITNSFQAVSCSGFADVRNCIIEGNAGSIGAALYAQDASSIVNCYVIGNEGDSIIELGEGSPILDHCTIANNSGDTIVRRVVDDPSGLGLIRNSILWNLGHTEVKGDIFIDYSCVDRDDIGGSPSDKPTVAVMLGDNNIFSDPMLDDYHLTGYSPCIDAGDPNYAEKWLDFEADPLHVGRTDIGVDQYQYFPRSPDLVPDGRIDMHDLMTFVSEWPKSGMSDGDLDYDRRCDLNDFSTFADWWSNFYPRLPTAWEQRPAYAEGTALDYGGVYLVQGGGSLYNPDRYVMYSEVTGSCEVTARLRFMMGDQYAYAGVIMLDDNYNYVLIGASQYAYDVSMHYFRGSDVPNFVSSGYLPRGSGWFKIAKADGLISVYDSEDGINWNLVHKLEDALPETVAAGVFVSSGDYQTLASGVFSDVAIRPLD